MITLFSKKTNLKNTNYQVVVSNVNYHINKFGVIIPTIYIYPSVDEISKIHIDNFKSIAELEDSCILEQLYIVVGDTIEVMIKDGILTFKFDEFTLRNKQYSDLKYVDLLPTICPFCNSDIDQGFDYHRQNIPICTNVNCPALLYKRIHNFLRCLNFTNDLVFKNIISKCITRGLIVDVMDVFLLDEKSLSSIEDLNKKYIDNILRHIMDIRLNLTLDKLIYALLNGDIPIIKIQSITNKYSSLPDLINDIVEGDMFIGQSYYQEISDEYDFNIWCIFQHLFEIRTDADNEFINKMMLLQLCF